jgi:LPXTG-motif cell wall-anchored protein
MRHAMGSGLGARLRAIQPVSVLRVPGLRVSRFTVSMFTATAFAAALVVLPGATGAPSALAAPTGLGSIVGAGYSAVNPSGVFRDFDADGLWDSGEPGQSGITVSATCVSDNGVDATSSFDDVYGPTTSTTTAANGSYTLSGPDVRGLCRVEFAIPANLQAFLQPGAATQAVVAPNSAGSFVQFVDSTLNPKVTTAVNNASDYTNPTSTPDVVVGLQDAGDSNNGSAHASSFATVYSTEYTGTTLTSKATANATGSIWGIAVQASSDTIFASALLKRHSGMGPAGPDAIYAIGAGAPAAWATPFTAVDTDGGAVLSNAVRLLANFNQPSDDDLAFSQAGKVSWGDLDISEDGTTLYAVNLLTKTIQPIDVETKVAGTAITIPDPGCTNGVNRPWALEVHDGLIYAGVVCDASTGGTAANLAAFVYAFNPTTVTLPVGGVPAGVAAGTWSGNLIDDGVAAAGVQLNYTKGCAVSAVGCGWNPWTDVYSEPLFGNGGFPTLLPQPILGDLEIDDDGSLLLGFIDRAGEQFGYRNVRPNSANQATTVEGVSGGDILRASVPSAAGTFTLENNGSVARGARLGGGTITGAGVGNNQGPGGGEINNKEALASVPHSETSLGSLAKAAGKDEYLLGVMDPLDTDSGGIGWFKTDGAARNDAVEIYDSTGASGFGKGNGLGDIELLNDLAPVEIGNRVWRDDNANGVQDPGEPPIAGVTVRLIIGTGFFDAVTDANGNYLFSSVARTGSTTVGFLAPSIFRFAAPNEPATLTILNATGGSQQAPLRGMLPSEVDDATANDPNVGANNANDSDGHVNGNNVEVTFTLGALAATNDGNAIAGDSVDREGFNRHLFDFGFVPRVSIGNRVWFDTNNSSTLDAGELPVAGVAVQLFYDANANGVVDVGLEQTPVAYDTTDGNGLYFFDQFTTVAGLPLATPAYLDPGNYVVGIAPSNFATAAVLDNYFSSGTTTNGSGVAIDPTAPDADTSASNTDDNGTTQTSGFYAAGVLSAPVTLTPTAEPTAEELGVFDNNDNNAIPDSSSNLTVDFGFYTQSFGNLVWLDNGIGGGNDDNGVVDGTEAGLAGVLVQLFASDGTTQIPVGLDGILGTLDDASGGTVTSAGGLYQFSGLPRGTYIVKIAAAGYRSSTDPAGVTTPFILDSDDNGNGVGSGVISSTAFLLQPGTTTPSSVTNNALGTTTNPRVDFGLVQPYDLTITKTTTSVGPYLANAPVTYSLVASNNGPGIALDGITVTDRLPVGLTFDVPATSVGSQWTCAAPVGAQVTCTWFGPTAGLGNDTLASAASLPAITVHAIVDNPAPNGVLVNFAVVEPSPNQSIPETVPLGTAPDKFEDGNPATGSNNDDSKPISSVPVVSVGDLVWIDANRNGQFDPAEAPIAGVIVTLLDGLGNPAVDAFSTLVPPTITDINGRYEFDGLLAGDYRVQFTLPIGYVWTTPNTGNDGLDSDPAPATLNAPTATTATFTVTPVPVVDADTSPFIRPVTNPTIDAGVVKFVSLGDLVWIDTNHNGQFDSTEAPVAGSTVTLLDGSGNPAVDILGNPVTPVLTDANGRYEFDGLAAGDYRVRFTLPAGYVWTTPNTGNDGLDSDAVPATPNSPTATTATFTLSTIAVTDTDTNTNARVVTNPTIDAGVVPVLAVGDYVWEDIDHDGIQDAGEPPVAGVTVTLVKADLSPAVDANGVAVPPVVTDANGHYVFDNLPPGDYVIIFTNIPTGYQITTQGAGGGTDSNPNSTGQTPVFTLSTTAADVTPVVGSDGVLIALVINRTIDAGIWKPIDEPSPPTVPPTVPPTTPPTEPPTTPPPIPEPLPTIEQAGPIASTVPAIIDLPETGSSNTGTLTAAALASLLGGLLIIVRRRRPVN